VGGGGGKKGRREVGLKGRRRAGEMRKDWKRRCFNE
jgi:hypothetical protein